MTKSLQEIQQENRRMIIETMKLPKSFLIPPQDLTKETLEEQSENTQRQINELLSGKNDK